VAVKVKAAGINPLDWKLRSGAMRQVMPLALPAVLGLDVYGMVDSPNGSAFASGERVIGLTAMGRFGGYAARAVVPATALARAPDGLANDIAAALPTVGLTAQELVDQLKHSAGRGNGERPAHATVLVLGAAGCVGTLARQLAARAGADEIAAVAREAQLDGLIGPAHLKITAEAPDFSDLGRSVDLVIDTIGGTLQAAAMRTLAPGGRIVSTVQPPDEALAAELCVTSAMVMVRGDGAALAELARLVADGDLLLPPVSAFDLGEAARAHAEGERGGFAKAVFVVEP
jgi:NADPH:quinone reductase-like Zn-dependent oxidoreductase